MRAALVGLLVLAACSGPSAGRQELAVFAAASLTDVFAALEPAYEATHDVDLVLSFDASSALRAQIEAGAPASVFLSADAANVQRLTDAGLTAGPPSTFTRNAIAIVAAESSDIAAWPDLATDGLRIVAAGADVPIQRYAEAVIDNLATLPDAPPGYAASVRANVVSREDNVRAVLAKVELGEGDAGFVYATDARGAGVRAIEIPDDANVAAAYQGAVTVVAAEREAARSFLSWLTEADAQAAFAAAGFEPLD